MDFETQAAQLNCPACACGGATRIISAEPHPRFARMDMRLFECLSCGERQEVVIPLSRHQAARSQADRQTAAT